MARKEDNYFYTHTQLFWFDFFLFLYIYEVYILSLQFSISSSYRSLIFYWTFFFFFIYIFSIFCQYNSGYIVRLYWSFVLWIIKEIPIIRDHWSIYCLLYSFTTHLCFIRNIKKTNVLSAFYTCWKENKFKI